MNAPGISHKTSLINNRCYLGNKCNRLSSIADVVAQKRLLVFLQELGTLVLLKRWI